MHVRVGQNPGEGYIQALWDVCLFYVVPPFPHFIYVRATIKRCGHHEMMGCPLYIFSDKVW